jgi:hypothetical protein
MNSKKKQNKLKRDMAMHNRFKELYGVQKLRLDVVWEQMEKEFFIDRVQIQRRIKELDYKYIQENKARLKIDL